MLRHHETHCNQRHEGCRTGAGMQYFRSSVDSAYTTRSPIRLGSRRSRASAPRPTEAESRRPFLQLGSLLFPEKGHFRSVNQRLPAGEIPPKIPAEVDETSKRAGQRATAAFEELEHR